jgi:hypothetical protein
MKLEPPRTKTRMVSLSRWPGAIAQARGFRRLGRLRPESSRHSARTSKNTQIILKLPNLLIHEKYEIKKTLKFKIKYNPGIKKKAFLALGLL